MSEFVAEQYLSATDAGAAGRGATAARLAADQLRREGAQVRFVRSIFVPGDETCIYIFEADSVDAVQLLAERASLRLDRIAEALTSHALPSNDTTNERRGHDSQAWRYRPRLRGRHHRGQDPIP